MKNKSINLRSYERRLNKLRLYSVQKEKTMTQIIEDFIDQKQFAIALFAVGN